MPQQLWSFKELNMKYKLDVKRDVDTDEPGVYILNLPHGFKFLYDALDVNHVYAYDTMKELKEDIKFYVGPCDCDACKQGLQK